MIAPSQSLSTIDGASTAAGAAGTAASSSAVVDSSTVASSLAAAVPITTASMPVVTSRPLLGVNGTGQRKSLATEPLSIKPTVVSDPINVTAAADQTATKKVIFKAQPPLSTTTFDAAASTSTAPFLRAATAEPTDSSKFYDGLINIDEVDKEEGLSNETISKHNITEISQQYHFFYNSSHEQDVEQVQNYYKSLTNLKTSELLSKSHRRAMVGLRIGMELRLFGND